MTLKTKPYMFYKKLFLKIINTFINPTELNPVVKTCDRHWWKIKYYHSNEKIYKNINHMFFANDSSEYDFE